MKRKKYDAEFKRHVIELSATSGKTDHKIESELDLFQGALGKWRQEFKKEMLGDYIFTNIDDAERKIFDYMEMF